MENQPTNPDDQKAIATWQAPRTGSLEQSSPPEAPLAIEGLENIKAKLTEIYQENFILAHQTLQENAQAILKSDKYDTFLQNTTLPQSPDEIAALIPRLDEPGPRQYTGTRHLDSDSILFLTFPKNLLPEHPKQIADSIDNGIASHSERGLPNNMIFGYYNRERLILNHNFDGIAPAEWKKSDFEDNSEPTIGPSATMGSTTKLPDPPQEIILDDSQEH